MTNNSSASPTSSGSSIRFALLAVGVWASFLIFGYCQEHLTRHEYGASRERFHHTQALVVAQSLSNVIVSAFAIRFLSGQHTSGGHKATSKWSAGVPLKDWLIVAVSYFLAHSFGLASLKYIIFPMQVVIKSCKAVPVMIGEILFARVRPSLAKTVGVLLLCAGVVVFTMTTEAGGHKAKTAPAAPNGMSPNAAMLYGVGLAGAALICDAVYGPYQNKIVAKYKPTSWVLMFNMNLFELIFALTYDVWTSTEIQEAIAFWDRHPAEFGYRVLLFCASMSIGNIFIYKIQREFGALAVTKTTTVRKLVSLVISILWFGHALGPSHYVAMALVFAAPVVEKRISKWEHGAKGKHGSKKSN